MSWEIIEDSKKCSKHIQLDDKVYCAFSFEYKAWHTIRHVRENLPECTKDHCPSRILTYTLVKRKKLKIEYKEVKENGTKG